MKKRMRYTALFIFSFFLFLGYPNPVSCQGIPHQKTKPVLVIHGGAGTILKSQMTPVREKEILTVLTEALNLGYAILEKGGTSMDAVENTIKFLENSPLFNAGKGSVLNHKGKVEMDAAIMNGQTKAAGAVAGVSQLKNPISAARLVLEKSKHVLLTGKGAEEFGVLMGCEKEDSGYFVTEERFHQLKRIQEKLERERFDTTGDIYFEKEEKWGTVGAVALDVFGNISAGTSTGGMMNKKFGRVGDSPLIGSGTYADNKTAGISCTGHGEYFIKNVVAYDVCALMKYKRFSLKRASRRVVQIKLKNIGAEGGLIGLDQKGNVVMEFNTPGMYRGFVKKGQTAKVFIYGL